MLQVPMCVIVFAFCGGGICFYLLVLRKTKNGWKKFEILMISSSEIDRQLSNKQTKNS